MKRRRRGEALERLKKTPGAGLEFCRRGAGAGHATEECEPRGRRRFGLTILRGSLACHNSICSPRHLCPTRSPTLPFFLALPRPHSLSLI